MINYLGLNLLMNSREILRFLVCLVRPVCENEVSQVPVCYFTKNEILMRKWLPPDVSADAEWSVIYQIVIPLLYRKEIISMAHDTPMSGHLGVNKTYHKILTHFYWPVLRKMCLNTVGSVISVRWWISRIRKFIKPIYSLFQLLRNLSVGE